MVPTGMIVSGPTVIQANILLQIMKLVLEKAEWRVVF